MAAGMTTLYIFTALGLLGLAFFSAFGLWVYFDIIRPLQSPFYDHTDENRKH